MKLKSRYMRYLSLSLIFSAFSSLSVLLCIIKVEKSAETLLNIIISLVFWLGLTFEQLFIWLANALRKKSEKEVNYTVQGLPGVCSFLKTELGFITDVTLALSLIVYIILLIGNWGINVTQYIFMFLIVLSFRWHCIANGKNYRYKLYLGKRRENDD